jgi:hypothetical protein
MAPPGELRESVLTAAREALAAENRPTIWDRIWESRALRLTWVGATAALVLAHVALTVQTGRPTAAPARDLAGAQQDVDDLYEIVQLPRVERVAMDFDVAPGEASSPVEETGTDPSMNGGQS